MTERRTVTLKTPIKRGTSELTEFQIRKPLGGDLRGVNLVDLLHLNADALITILPRITAPSINKQEAAQLDFIDLTSFGMEIISFLPSISGTPEDALDV